MKSLIWRIPKDELLNVIARSNSLSQILRNIGLKSSGGSLTVLKRRLAIDGIRYTNTKIESDPIDISNLFVKGSKHCRTTLRKYVLKLGLKKYTCAICDIDPVWNSKPLALRLDHIDGDNSNNCLNNLRFVCPNCDSQLSTYGGRNIKHTRHHCAGCNVILKRKTITGYCKTCVKNVLKHKTNKPDRDELSRLVWLYPASVLAEHFCVSDKAISKWCLKYGIDKPGPGYWSKRSSDK